MKKIIFTTIAALLGAFPLIAADAPVSGGVKAEVRLIDTISVQAPEITLGSIATIDCQDASRKEKIASLVIGSVPAINSPTVISSARIKSILEQQGLDKEVALLGNQTTVTTAARKVGDEELIGIIRDYITKHLDEGVQADIDCMRLPASWKIPEGSNVKIEVDVGRSKLAGDIMVTLRALIGGQVLATTRAKVHVTLYRDCAVLVHPVMRNDKLSSNDFEVRRADVTSAKGMESTKPQELVGLVAKRDLSIGSLVSVKDFDQPIAIARGSINRLIVVNGPIKLTIDGAQALQSGKVGENILFSNPMNQKQTLRAEIVKAGVGVINIE